MFNKLFKGGNNDFYLEIEEETKDAPSKPSQPTTTSNGNGARPPAVATPTPEAKPAAEAAVKTEAVETETATQESGTARKKTFRKSKVAKKETAPASTPAPAPTPTPAPVAVSPKDLEENQNTFAPRYLIPTSTNGRRRPGPNMNSFLEMAGQVKVNTSKSTIKPKTIASSKAPTPVVTETPAKSKSKATAKSKAKTSEKSETTTPAETTA